MAKKFYISDTHFDHFNIIRLAKRPFKTLDEMNETMVKNWNSVVTDADHVYVLGDFAWHNAGTWFHQLKGFKHLIEGNHDMADTLKLPWTSRSFYKEVTDEGDKPASEGGIRKVVLFHYPITDWNLKFYGSVHLFGHVHNRPQNITGPAFDVGAEAMNYTPRTLKEILLLRYGNIDTNTDRAEVVEALQDSWSKMPKIAHP